jgi:hypothetical protein
MCSGLSPRRIPALNVGSELMSDNRPRVKSTSGYIIEQLHFEVVMVVNMSWPSAFVEYA